MPALLYCLHRSTTHSRDGTQLVSVNVGLPREVIAIVRLDQPADSLTVAAVAELLFANRPNQENLRVAATLPALPEGMRAYFQEWLEQ